MTKQTTNIGHPDLVGGGATTLHSHAGGGGGAKSLADYIIYKVDSTYYAQNGSTFAIDYSGTNCAVVMNSCLANPNVNIQVRAGSYTLTESVTMNHLNQVVRGAGPGSTIFTVSGNIDGFQLGEGSSEPKNFFLESMTIDHTGTATDARGIYMNVAMRTTVRDMVIKNFSGSGALAGAIVTDKDCWYMMFQGIRMVDNDYICYRSVSDDASDNGQMTWMDCEICGTHDNIKRSPATAGSLHRILFARCIIALPTSHASGTYAADLRGFGGVTFIQCDFESSFADMQMVKIDGGDITFHGCQFSCANASNFAIIRTGSDFSPPSRGGFYGCSFSLNANETSKVCYSTTTLDFFGCYLNYGSWADAGVLINGFGNHGVAFPFTGALGRYVVSAGVAPTLTYEGETVHWRDTTASKTWLMIRVNATTCKVECS